ncbi:Cell cycle control protein 50A [Paragonimus heterotremus]|uniref:Cell cycle control protein 50A n=1 Tax=Paragonimus heterotremus TaxID=100268 RepID=A0A8J4SP30_9TREM|nr:Cell cycle control protein 50A [Paragonimus heterotremus]
MCTIGSRFHQQRLKSWRPVLTAEGIFPVFLAIGILFIPVGVGLLIASNQVFERIFEYTHCERSDISGGNMQVRCSEEVRKASFYGSYRFCPCTVSFTLSTAIKGQIYFFYGLSNFFQNHRRYVLSKDDLQLHGETGVLSEHCEPYRLDAQKRAYAPCGAIAMSLFNGLVVPSFAPCLRLFPDTFSMTYHGPNSAPLAAPINVPMSKKNIAWRSDVDRKYGRPPNNSWANTVKPESWPKTALERSPDAYSGDEELLVWMRPAALPTFRKLHRIIEHKGVFESAYPVTQFGGTKRFILSTTNFLGGSNPTLGIAYIVMGAISLLLGFLFLILHYRLPRRLKPN